MNSTKENVAESDVNADSAKFFQRNRFSVAPMMDWTDRHCRYFHRQLTRHALLYTEMVTTWALLNGDVGYLLRFSPEEQPVALQLGGCDPKALAHCAQLAEDKGYVEVNLNVGCPSDRVQAARFGACLMREPTLVAECIAAMRSAVRIPVTVKCRIGVDDQDELHSLFTLVESVAATGCDTFIVHARKAWLKGLSPKENREIPPLNYELVYALKRAMPHLFIVLNGGIASLDDAQRHLGFVDGVMLGRAAYHDTWVLADVDRRVFAAANPVENRVAAIERMMPYIEAALADGTPLRSLTRHLLGLWQGQPGARRWRRCLSADNTGTIDTLTQALAQMRLPSARETIVIS